MLRSCTDDYLIDWLNATLASKSPRTREGYAYVTRRLFAYLTAAHYPTELAELRPMHFRAFLASLRGDGLSANSAANFDRTLRAIFGRIDREGREDFDLGERWRNPLASVERQKPVAAPKTPLSEDEAHRLIATAPRRGFIAYRNLAEIAFMLMTGARSIEVRNLRIDNVSLDQRLVDLRVTKGGKPRYVHLPVRLARIMANYLRRRERKVGQACNLVFPTRSGDMQSRRALHRTVQRAGDRIGVSALGPHRLRHSYVTLSHAKGAPLRFLQEQCGHSSVLVTQGYITLSAVQKSALADRYCVL
jgi:integrase/recombinase XerC